MPSKEKFLSSFTNELGIVVRDNRVLQAYEAAELHLRAGEFISVGLLQRNISTLKMFCDLGLVKSLTLIDIDGDVVSQNMRAVRWANLSMPIIVRLGSISQYETDNVVFCVDWSNTFNWQGYNSEQISPSLNNTSLNLVSDFLNGRIAKVIEDRETIPSFKGLVSDFEGDMNSTIQIPSSQRKLSSLHALATTIPPAILFS